MDEGDKTDRQRIVRLKLERALKLSQGRLVITMAIIMKQTKRDMCFGEIGRECYRLLCHSACVRQFRFAQRVRQPMTPQPADSQLCNSKCEVRVVRDRFLVPAFRLLE